MAEINFNQIDFERPLSVDEVLGSSAKDKTTFSMRFLFGVTALYALVFALIGAVGRDWSPRQMYVCMCLILGWGATTGLAVYSLLNWRRDRQIRLGQLLYRSRAVTPRKPTYSYRHFVDERAVLWSSENAPGPMAVVLFLVWCGCITGLVHLHDWKNGTLMSAVSDLPVRGWTTVIAWWVAQCWSLYLLLQGRAAALEIRARGMVVRTLGKVTWKRVTATRWAASDPQLLVCEHQLPGGGGQVDQIFVPFVDRGMVDHWLAACLGKRHAKLAEERLRVA